MGMRGNAAEGPLHLRADAVTLSTAPCSLVLHQREVIADPPPPAGGMADSRRPGLPVRWLFYVTCPCTKPPVFGKNTEDSADMVDFLSSTFYLRVSIEAGS